MNSTSAERINRVLYWVSDHWLLCFNTIVGLYVFLPILAPILMGAGLRAPAQLIYQVYKPTCHQMAFRSFFIGGDQSVYPRELAGVDHVHDFESFAERLDHFRGVPLEGLQPELIFSARTFLGNAEMGFKTAICQRDLGIFGFLFLGGVLYGVLRRFGIRIRPMPLWAFILIGMAPIALDGFSQLFGYYGDYGAVFEIVPNRESPPWLRTATGAWFGFCVAWLAIPYLDASMQRDNSRRDEA